MKNQVPRAADSTPSEVSYKKSIGEMYLIIFDKSGRSLSGWHYGELRRLRVQWIQKSAMKVDSLEKAVELAKLLRRFKVQKLHVFRAVDVTGTT